METTVATKYGKIRGTVLKNIKGNDLFAFLGIPYAKPPIGHLRFKAPQPPEKWQGVRDATKEGNPCYCIQHTIGENGEFVVGRAGSEDCLYLNVFSNQLSEKSLKPVMVYIHGGGFSSGSGTMQMYGPEILLTEDVVLVTINYRLGIFGFLAFEDPSLDIPGNAAMKDMVLALSWVQQNIKNFGGNPENVTIFGQSAGGASVNYLTISSMAKGLFHRAIMHSGAAICTWAQGQKAAPFLAKHLGVDEKNEKEITKILENMTTEELFDLQIKSGDIISIGENLKIFSPVVESSSHEGPKFLEKEAIEKMKSGDFNQVPIMLGYTSKEAYSLSFFDEKKGGCCRLPDGDNLDFAPYLLNLKSRSEESKAVTKRILEFYFGNSKYEANTEPDYLFISDYYINYGIHLASQIFASKSKCPVYLYRFDLDTELNGFKKLTGITSPGAAHCDELPYLFGFKNSPKILPGSKEEASMQMMVDLWTNFAKTGNPNKPNENNLHGIQWTPMSKNHQAYLDIGEKLKLGVAPDSERMEFWEKIFENTPYNVNV